MEINLIKGLIILAMAIGLLMTATDFSFRSLLLPAKNVKKKHPPKQGKPYHEK
jgi:hypothetical protein